MREVFYLLTILLFERTLRSVFTRRSALNQDQSLVELKTQLQEKLNAYKQSLEEELVRFTTELNQEAKKKKLRQQARMIREEEEHIRDLHRIHDQNIANLRSIKSDRIRESAMQSAEEVLKRGIAASIKRVEDFQANLHL